MSGAAARGSADDVAIRLASSVPLADALRAVGSQANINVLFDPPLVAGRTVPALKADLTIDQALSQLLEGTGIKHEFLNEKTVVLEKAGTSLDNHGASSSETPASDSAAKR